MTNEIKYGVISDVHQDPRIVSIAIDILKNQGAQKLLVNGDIGTHLATLQDSQNYTAFILDSIGKSGLEAFVQPGSHETIGAYGPVVEYFSKKYANLVDVIKNPKIEDNNNHLIFLPGSDFLCGGEYQIIDGENKTGIYQTDNGLISIHNMQDLRKLVTSPEKTIVVCHVPRKFDNIETCVDATEFGEAISDFYLDGREIEKGSVFPIQVARAVVKTGAPVKIRKENRGNQNLRRIYEELGIKKAVSGHFHESGQRANDSQGNHIQEGQLVSDLFWNSGHLDAGQTGILTVFDGKISYRNIKLQDYIK